MKKVKFSELEVLKWFRFGPPTHLRYLKLSETECCVPDYTAFPVSPGASVYPAEDPKDD